MAIIDKKITENYAIYNGDCIEVMKDIPDNKIHMAIYSPPFGGLYNYSSDVRDLSNCYDYKEFFDHYDFVLKELFRITMPGRINAVHCKEILSGNTGSDYLIDFPGDIIKAHETNGFKLIARHTIWKEPLWVRNLTMLKSLTHKCIVDDATLGGVANADYLLIFRKKGKNQIPVTNPNGLQHYSGQCSIPFELQRYKNWSGDQKENRYSHWIWRRYASSIWDDIDVGRVLPFQDCKDPDDEKHVHALQLDVIDRAVTLRTNKNETVFTPFMGVGSEVYSPVALGRKGIGVELKTSYYRQAVKNMELCEPDIYLKNTFRQKSIM